MKSRRRRVHAETEAVDGLLAATRMAEAAAEIAAAAAVVVVAEVVVPAEIARIQAAAVAQIVVDAGGDTPVRSVYTVVRSASLRTMV